MACSPLPPSLLQTKQLLEIVVDYTPEACSYNEKEGEIAITFDERGGARWRSPERFEGGTFSVRIKGPAGNTSGLNYNIYLSSLEGDKSQDEIDFEFLGIDRSIVQTLWVQEIERCCTLSVSTPGSISMNTQFVGHRHIDRLNG